MRNALRFIIVLSLFLIARLAAQSVLTSGYELLDGVIPSRILNYATREERFQMVERLGALHRPHIVSWVPPIFIFLLASYALLAANRTSSK